MNNFVQSELISAKSDFNNLEEDCQDIANSIVEELLKSFESSEIWSETVENNEVNNKRILSYVYRMLTTSRNQFFNSTHHKEEINFARAVRDSLNKLVDDDKLSAQEIQHSVFYHLPQKTNLLPYDQENINLRSRINVWRGKRKEQLDHQAIKHGIIQIIRSLEKYKFTSSDLIRIIKNNSNINMPEPGGSGINGGEPSSEEELFIDPGDKPDVIESEHRKKAQNIFNNLRKLYPQTNNGNKTFEDDIKIYYWIFTSTNLTQAQISLRVFNEKGRFRSISTRLKGVEKKIIQLKNSGKINADTKELKAFLQLIKDRCIIKNK